jgi:hypothetical protein
MEAHILIQLNMGQNSLKELASYDLLRILIPFSVRRQFLRINGWYLFPHEIPNISLLFYSYY